MKIMYWCIKCIKYYEMRGKTTVVKCLLWWLINCVMSFWGGNSAIDELL